MSSKQLTNSALGTIIYPLTNGPVAQLGAHHIRIVGVVGSNPIRSTKRKGLFFTAPFLAMAYIKDVTAVFCIDVNPRIY